MGLGIGIEAGIHIAIHSITKLKFAKRLILEMSSLGKGVFLPPIVPYLSFFGKLALKLLYFTRREQ
jgi:hypothetical protein